MKIGVFDSGLGGLFILTAVRELLPEYDYIYYGDTKNLPYGDKTEEEIHAFTRASVEELFMQGALLVIIACNTASAETLRRLQDTILVGPWKDRRILGVIIPTIETLLASNLKDVLIIGTRRTIESGKYERELDKHYGADMHLSLIPTPELVPMIESNMLTIAYAYLDSIVRPRMGEIDGLVLGCTHYTVLKNGLRAGYPKLRIFSQDEIIPGKLSTYLKAHPEIEKRLTREKTLEQIITGNNPGGSGSHGE